MYTGCTLHHVTSLHCSTLSVGAAASRAQETGCQGPTSAILRVIRRVPPCIASMRTTWQELHLALLIHSDL